MPTYTGLTFAQVKQVVEGVVLREMSDEAALQDLLLGLCVNTALRTIEDSYDNWRVLEATVTTDDAGSTLQTTPASREVPLPARYKGGFALYRLDGNSREPIPATVGGKPITMPWIRENHPDPTETSDTPLAACIYGENIILVPTPASAITLELDCRCYVADLAEAGDRNWFTMHLAKVLTDLAAGEAFDVLGEDALAGRWLEKGRARLSARIGSEITELVRRTPLQLGQEPTGRRGLAP